MEGCLLPAWLLRVGAAGQGTYLVSPNSVGVGLHFASLHGCPFFPQPAFLQASCPPSSLSSKQLNTRSPERGILAESKQVM